MDPGIIGARPVRGRWPRHFDHLAGSAGHLGHQLGKQRCAPGLVVRPDAVAADRLVSPQSASQVPVDRHVAVHHHRCHRCQVSNRLLHAPIRSPRCKPDQRRKSTHDTG